MMLPTIELPISPRQCSQLIVYLLSRRVFWTVRGALAPSCTLNPVRQDLQQLLANCRKLACGYAVKMRGKCIAHLCKQV